MKKFFIILLIITLYSNKSQAGFFTIKDESYVSQYLIAQYLYKNQNINKAAKYYEKAYNLNQSNYLIRKNIDIQLENSNIDKAGFYAKEYLKIDPQSISENIILAIIALKNKDYKKFEQYILSSPNSKRNETESVIDYVIRPYLLIWAKFSQKKYDEAIKISNKLKSESNYTLRFLNYQNALMYDLMGDIENAAIEYEKSLKYDNSPYNFVKSAGNFYQRNKYNDKAKKIYINFALDNPKIDYFQNSLKEIDNNITPNKIIKNPADGVNEVLYEAARALYEADILEEAIKYLQLIKYLNNDHDENNILLANYFENKNLLTKANSIYEKISSNSDFFTSVQVNIAENLFDMNQKKTAFNLLKKSYDNDTKNFSYLLSMGELYRKDEDYLKAKDVYSQIIAKQDKDSNMSWAVYFLRGICYERLDDWEMAEKDLLKSLELNPDQPDALNYLAYSWLERDHNLHKAKYMIEKAVRKKPYDIQIIDSMGWALFKLEKYDLAAKYLEKAAETMPYDAIINNHLGDIYWKQGRYNEAQFQWNRVLKYNPHPLKAEDIIKKISHGLPSSSETNIALD